jgi:hypothetical protein
MNTDRFVPLGPVAVPIVPITHFRKLHFDPKELEGIWRICGPSVEHNIRRHPLWLVICMAYLEGLDHGASLERMKHDSL